MPAALVVLLACAVLAGCGKSGSSGGGATTTTTSAAKVPAALAAARDERRCSSLAADQACMDYDRVEAWYRDGTLRSADVAGAVAFVQNGCGTCHVYRDIGTQNLDAPELTHEGGARDAAAIERAIVCPTCVNPDAKMPPFKSLPKRSVEELAAFLAASS
jgi:hypothetical protein